MNVDLRSYAMRMTFPCHVIVGASLLSSVHVVQSHRPSASHPGVCRDSPTQLTVLPATRRVKSKGKGKASKKYLRRQQQGAESEEDDGGEGGEEEDSSEGEDEQEEEEDEDGGTLTAHTEHSRRMKSKITDQERELLAEKPWALRGEVHSHDRPQNRCLCVCRFVPSKTYIVYLPHDYPATVSCNCNVVYSLQIFGVASTSLLKMMALIA